MVNWQVDLVDVSGQFSFGAEQANPVRLWITVDHAECLRDAPLLSEGISSFLFVATCSY